MGNREAGHDRIEILQTLSRLLMSPPYAIMSQEQNISSKRALWAHLVHTQVLAINLRPQLNALGNHHGQNRLPKS